MSRELKISDSDKVALVDDEDYDRLAKFKWHLTGSTITPSISRDHYITRKFSNRKHLSISLSSEVLCIPGKLVDHKDRDPFNNTKLNLRQCTYSQNSANRVKQPGFSSKFKGVGWFSRDSKWRAVIKFCGRYMHIGYFEKEEDAARAYNAKAKELFGEFAVLNSV